MSKKEFIAAALAYVAGFLTIFLLAAESCRAQALEPVSTAACTTVLHMNGLVERQYDEDQDGTPDHYTLTRMGRDQQPNAHPLFYGQDQDQNGEWETVYIDREEDGINGNEELYERQ